MRVIQLKFTKTTCNFFQNGGGGGRPPGAPVLDPPLMSKYDFKDADRRLVELLCISNRNVFYY